MIHSLNTSHISLQLIPNLLSKVVYTLVSVCMELLQDIHMLFWIDCEHGELKLTMPPDELPTMNNACQEWMSNTMVELDT